LSDRSAPVLRFAHFAVPKDAHYPTEMEDACAIDASTGVVAVIDGASSGYDPVEWSRTLANAVLDLGGGEAGICIEALAAIARERWGRRGALSLPPGIAEKPTGATVGLMHFRRSKREVQLDAQSVGDVNLMICRSGNLPVVPTDLARAADYDTTPQTLNSTALRSVTIRRMESIPLQSDDMVLMFTDGFGKWLVDRAGNPAVIDHLRAIDGPSFVDLVRTEQASNRMEIDDVMLVRCRLA
jgi:hypothetical protein